MVNLTRRSFFILQQKIRDFFRSRGFWDVLTPPAVPHPGMETHLHPFQLFSPKRRECEKFYLHTSPEFALKKLLGQGLGNLFSLNYCFRDEPPSSTHRFQFLMLEWYRVERNSKENSYKAVEKDVVDLLEDCRQVLKGEKGGVKWESALCPEVLTVEQAFVRWAGFSLSQCETQEHFLEAILSHCPFLLPPQGRENLEWEDLFFIVFLNLIEPPLKKIPLVILKEYPAPLAALSRLKKENPRVCERFEVYLGGLELGNCFYELLDLEELKGRFEREALRKKKLYGYSLDRPWDFYKTMAAGLPPCSGIALGVERLFMGLTGKDFIEVDLNSV